MAVGLDGVKVCFDDERVVSDAGVMLAATLAGRLGIEALAGELVRLRGDRPGAANREVLHIRLRKGSANTQKGIERFIDELVARIARAGATGERLLRADSGFWNTNVFTRLEKAGWRYSIAVRMTKTVCGAVEQ